MNLFLCLTSSQLLMPPKRMVSSPLRALLLSHLLLYTRSIALACFWLVVVCCIINWQPANIKCIWFYL